MLPEGLNQLIDIKQFCIKHSDATYQVRKTATGDCRLYKIDGVEEFVGYITNFGYFFKITYHLGGLTLSKEIAYSEIIIKK